MTSEEHILSLWTSSDSSEHVRNLFIFGHSSPTIMESHMAKLQSDSSCINMDWQVRLFYFVLASHFGTLKFFEPNFFISLLIHLTATDALLPSCFWYIVDSQWCLLSIHQLEHILPWLYHGTPLLQHRMTRPSRLTTLHNPKSVIRIQHTT